MTDESDHLGRAHRHNGYTEEERISLLERDVEGHSRIISEFVKRDQGFSDEQKEQMRDIFREVLGNAGLRLDEAEHVDASREDFRFIRKWRLMWEGAANKVGNGVLTALIVVGLTIIGLGFWAWINSGGHK